ncbi:outer membrane immunogenic protein [Bradyrhizobium sp. LM2.7]
MNKNLLLAAVSLVALSAAAPALAADLAARPYTKAPAMVAAIYDWSGFYIGINGGGASARSTWDAVGFGREGSHDATGGTVGGQIGYRWQSGQWVFGVEGQGNWADFSGDNLSSLFATRNRSKIDSFGLITGQVGYAWNNVLLYAKGGAAVVGAKYEVFDAASGALLGSNDQTRWGVALSVPASSTASRQTGRLASSTTTSSCRTRTSRSRWCRRPIASVRTSTWASCA